MLCNSKIRNMIFFSATQQNYCFISPGGIFRMPENCLFPFNGVGEGGREVGQGIRKGKSVTSERAPKEGGQRDPVQGLCGSSDSSTSFSYSGPSGPLCPSPLR